MKELYTVRLATAEEFSASRDAWNAIVERMHYPTPFVTWEWVYTWWEHMDRDSTMLPMFVYRGNAVVAILPVFRNNGAHRGWPKATMIDYAASDTLFADHVDIICEPNQVERCGMALLSFLKKTYKDWDVLRIPMIAEDGGLRKVFWRNGQGLTIEWRARSIAPYTSLAPTYEEFMARLPRKDRHTVRSQHRKAFDEGARYVVFDGSATKTGLEHLFALHEKRASQKGIDSTFTGDAIRRFHFALAERLAGDRLMLRGLYLNDQMVACLYAFQIGKRVFLYQVGHDPAHAKRSPGVAVITESIREAIEAGCIEYNFLQGDEPYKRNWARRSRRLLQLRIYNRTLAGRWLHAGASIRQVAKRVVRRWFARSATGAGLHEHLEGA